MSFPTAALLPWLKIIDARPTGAHCARVNAGAVGGLRSPDTIITNDLLFLAELQQRNTPAVTFCVSSEMAGAIKLCADFHGGHIARTLPRLTRVTEGRKMERSTMPMC